MNKINPQYLSDRHTKNIQKREMCLRDEGAMEYDTQISDYQHSVEIASIMKKLNPQKGEYILDLGCGTGRVTYTLIESGCMVIALDFSKESLKVCKERCDGLQPHKNNLYLITGDVCNLPLKDCCFDKYVSSEVFEQIPLEKNRLKMLQEINKVLKPNGKLLLTTYNYSLRKIISRKRETLYPHLYFYRYDYFELKKIISSVFKDKPKIVGILNLNHWVPVNLLNRFEKTFIIVDHFIEKTPFSYLLAHLLSVECKKIDHGKK